MLSLLRSNAPALLVILAAHTRSLRMINPEDRISYLESPVGGSTRIGVRDDGTFGHGVSGLFGRRVAVSDFRHGLEA